MNTTKRTITAIIMAAFMLALGSAWAGDLTPPGAPAPTMKTLDQVEPRTPISSAPYTISEPGSYYLTTNLTSAGHGVVITTNGVTLDLMGFTLSGDGGSVDYGVFVEGATNRVVEHVVVRNGAVNNFRSGIRADYSMGGRFEQLAVFDNTYSGVHLYGEFGQCDGNTITDCTVSGNGSFGVFLSGSSGQCDGNTITDCTISGNGSYGVYFYAYAGQCDGNTIANCTISGNGGYGISLYGGAGQCDGNTIVDCAIRKNRDRGIYLSASDGNRVEGNHVTGQTGDSMTYGIRCTTTSDNLIIRNSCVGQTDNFVFDADDTYGPEVTASGALSTTGDAAHPLANFSF